MIRETGTDRDDQSVSENTLEMEYSSKATLSERLEGTYSSE